MLSSKRNKKGEIFSLSRAWDKEHVTFKLRLRLRLK